MALNEILVLAIIFRFTTTNLTSNGEDIVDLNERYRQEKKEAREGRWMKNSESVLRLGSSV